MQVLLRDDHTYSRCQGFDLEATVADLREELLSKAHLVDGVEVVPLVDVLVHSTRVLLPGVDVEGQLLPVQLEGPSECARLLVKELERSLKQEPMHLILQDLDLTVSLLMLL